MRPQRHSHPPDGLLQPKVQGTVWAIDVLRRSAITLAALWWGSLTALSLWVVPLLVTHMPNPSAVGALAAKLFAAQSWVGIACAVLLLMVLSRKPPETLDRQAQTALKFIVAGLLLALLAEFAVAPRIVGARAVGGNWKPWHFLSAGLNFLQWYCAGVALWRLSAAQDSKASSGVVSDTELRDDGP